MTRPGGRGGMLQDRTNLVLRKKKVIAYTSKLEMKTSK